MNPVADNRDVTVRLESFVKETRDGLWDLVAMWLPAIGRWRVRRADKLRQAGVEAYSKGDPSLAIRHFSEALNWSPRDPELHCDLAQVYYERGQAVEAEREYRQALEYDHHHQRALKGLGFVSQQNGRQDEALYNFLRFLEKDDRDVSVLINTGVALHDSGNYSDALHYYERAEALDPKNPLIRENRARVLYALGNIDDAIRAVRASLELDWTNARAHAFMGTLLEAKGDWEAARAAYEETIAQDGQNAAARLQLARILSVHHEEQKALDHALRALETLRSGASDTDLLVTAYSNLGWYHYRLGQLEQSVRASREALQVDPKHFQTRFNLALALLESGQPDRAFEEYRTGAAELSLASDLNKWAIEDLEQALVKKPDLPQGDQILQMLNTQYEGMLRTRGLVPHPNGTVSAPPRSPPSDGKTE